MAGKAARAEASRVALRGRGGSRARVGRRLTRLPNRRVPGCAPTWSHGPLDDRRPESGGVSSVATAEVQKFDPDCWSMGRQRDVVDVGAASLWWAEGWHRRLGEQRRSRRRDPRRDQRDHRRVGLLRTAARSATYPPTQPAALLPPLPSRHPWPHPPRRPLPAMRRPFITATINSQLHVRHLPPSGRPPSPPPWRGTRSVAGQLRALSWGGPRRQPPSPSPDIQIGTDVRCGTSGRHRFERRARSVDLHSSVVPVAEDDGAPDQDVLGGPRGWQSGDAALAPASDARYSLRPRRSKMEPTGMKRLLQLTPLDRTVHRAAYTDTLSPRTISGLVRSRSGFGLRYTVRSEPSPTRVVGPIVYGPGSRASASISTFHLGSSKPATTIIVAAGRTAVKARPCSAPTASASVGSIRYIRVRTTAARSAPASARAAEMIWVWLLHFATSRKGL